MWSLRGAAAAAVGLPVALVAIASGAMGARPSAVLAGLKLPAIEAQGPHNQQAVQAAQLEVPLV